MNRGQQKDVKRLVFRGGIAYTFIDFCADLLLTGNFDASERPWTLGFPCIAGLSGIILSLPDLEVKL